MITVIPPHLPPPPPSHPFPNPNPRKPKPPFIQRTLKETTFCYNKGFCYNCDEKWSASHWCKGHVLLLIIDPFESPNTFLAPSSPTLESDPDPSLEPATPPTSPHINIHALAGLPATDTFRVLGTICHARLTVLVNNGSTHNFIQPQVAKLLNLQAVKTEPLRIMVGNGSLLECLSWCPTIEVQLQGHPFTVDLRLLPIHGVDVVLGVEWLRTLRSILIDYTVFTMNFTHLGLPVCLCADVHTSPSQASAHQLWRMIHTHSTSSPFHLSLLSTPP